MTISWRMRDCIDKVVLYNCNDCNTPMGSGDLTWVVYDDGEYYSHGYGFFCDECIENDYNGRIGFETGSTLFDTLKKMNNN